MKIKYKDMKCPYCEIKMFRFEGNFADCGCNKCKWWAEVKKEKGK